MKRNLLSLAIASGMMWGGIVWADDTNKTPPQTPPQTPTDIRAADPSLTPPPVDKGVLTPVLPAGISPKQLNDQEDIRDLLAEATNAAFTKGGFDDLVERLSSADRTRIGKFAERDFTEIDGRIDQIRKAWEQKYGQSFNLDNQQLFAGFVQIQEGEVLDAAAASKGWPVMAYVPRDPMGTGMNRDGMNRDINSTVNDGVNTGINDANRAAGNAANDANRAAGGVANDANRNADGTIRDVTPGSTASGANDVARSGDTTSTTARDRAAGQPAPGAGTGTGVDTNNAGGTGVTARTGSTAENLGTAAGYLEKGRNVAIVTIPMSHNLPAIHVSMMHEPVDDWRIDINDSITPQQLHDNLKTCLTMIGENTDKWPNDVNQAYQMVAHKILLAVNDVKITKPGDVPTAGADVRDSR